MIEVGFLSSRFPFNIYNVDINLYFILYPIFVSYYWKVYSSFSIFSYSCLMLSSFILYRGTEVTEVNNEKLAILQHLGICP